MENFPEETPKALQEVGEMIEFTPDRPEANQPPLHLRGEISQEQWEMLTPEEQNDIRNR